MKIISRRTLVIAAIVLAVPLLLALTLPLWLKVDKFRPRIEKELSAMLLRPVKLGHLSLRLLPLPTLTVGESSIGGNQVAGDAPLVAFKKATTRVQLLPLFKKQIRVHSIEVDGLVLELRRDRRGKLNLERWMAEMDDASRQQKSKPAGNKKEAAPAGGPADLTLSKVKFKEMEIRYQKAGGKPVSIPISLEMTDFGMAQSTVRLALAGSKVSYDGRLDLQGLDGALTVDPFALGDIEPLLAIAGNTLPGGLKIDGELKIKGTAKVEFARPEALEYRMEATLNGATLHVPTLDVPLTRVGFTATVDPQMVDIQTFSAQLLKSDLAASAKIRNWLKAPAVTFNVTSDRLEIGEITNHLKGGEASGGGGGGEGGGGGFTAAGSVAVKEGGFGIFRFAAFKSDLRASPKQLRLEKMQAGFFGGKLAADARLMNRAGTFEFNADLAGLDLKSFMTAIAGSPYVTGLARATVNGRGKLADWKNLTGAARITAADGEIAHFPLIDTINKAFSLTGMTKVGGEEMKYSSLSADFNLGGGAARTDNLQLYAPLLDATAIGRVNFDTQIDFKGESKLSKARSAEMIQKAGQLKYMADKEQRINVPFTAKGPAAEPAVSVDTTALAKKAGGAVLDQKKEEAKEKLGEKAKEKIGGFLGGLFGKEKEPASSP